MLTPLRVAQRMCYESSSFCSLHMSAPSFRPSPLVSAYVFLYATSRGGEAEAEAVGVEVVERLKLDFFDEERSQCTGEKLL